MGDFVRSYKINDNWKNESEKYPKSEKVPVWVCWWQGEESMPELVKMCFKTSERYITKLILRNYI